MVKNPALIIPKGVP